MGHEAGIEGDDSEVVDFGEDSGIRGKILVGPAGGGDTRIRLKIDRDKGESLEDGPGY